MSDLAHNHRYIQHLEYFPEWRTTTRAKAIEISNTLDECEKFAEIFPEWRDSIRVKAESICTTIADWIKFSNYFIESEEKASLQALGLATNIEEYYTVAGAFPTRLYDARSSAFDICYDISDFAEFVNYFPEWSDKAKSRALDYVNSLDALEEYAYEFHGTYDLASLWLPSLFNKGHNFPNWEKDELAKAMEFEDYYVDDKMMHYYFLPPNSYAALTFMELPDGYFNFSVYDETGKKWLKATNSFPVNMNTIPIIGGSLYANVYTINPSENSRLLRIDVESKSTVSVEYGIHSLKAMYSSQDRIESWILGDIGGYLYGELDYSNLDWTFIVNLFGSESVPDYFRNVLIDIVFDAFIPQNYPNKIYTNELKSFMKELTKNVD